MKNYDVQKVLGQGGFGKALLAKRKSDGQLVVIKETLGQGVDAVDAARKESELLKRMHHPYIIQCYDTFMEGSNFYIVTEYATGNPGDLGNKLEASPRGLPEAQVVNYVMMLCSALAHVHRAKCVHRDIKPANIFLMADGSIKLGDFGIGRTVQATMAFAQTANGAGTLPFMAPELLAAKFFGAPTDIWAVGVTAYLLLSKQFPFTTGLELLMGDPPPLPGVSQPFQKLIGAMLSKDPDERPTAMQIQAHPVMRPLKVVCWRDPKVRNAANDATLRAMQARYSGKLTLVAAETDADALDVISISDKSRLWVITNRGDDGPGFIKKVRAAGVKSQVLVFCGTKEGWVSMPNVTIDTSGSAVQTFLDSVVR